MGILTNDNFDVNAPKNIDSRYSVAGVTPYASVAAANAAISITRRAIGLTVNVNGDEYWYKNGTTDPDLILKSSGGGSTVVPITKAALLALIAASTVVIGTVYSVTDAQDALGGTITVLGTGVNTVDGNGIWSFVGNLPAQGRIKFLTGTAGSVTQIVVTTPGGPVNAMTASVPYTTSRNNTATLVAANINANTGVSGIRAHVITSTTGGGNFDTPTLVIEVISAQTGFSYTITPTLVTLTSTNTPGTLGFASNSLRLNSFYDLTNDRILYASDPVMWCTVDCTLARITALGYNPVTTFRWRDPRFVTVRLIDSGIRNTTFRNLATATWRNVTFTGTNIQNCIFTNVAQTNVDILNGSTVNNVNCISLTLTNHSGTVNIQNVDAAAINVVNNLRGNFTLLTSTFGNATTNASISFSNNYGACNIQNVNSSGVGSWQLVGNYFLNTSLLTINGFSCTGIVTVSNNFVYSSISLSSNTSITNITINKNICKGGITINSITNTGDINILRNEIGDDSLSAGFNLVSSTVTTIDITDSSFILTFPSSSIFTTGLNVSDSVIQRNTDFGQMNGSFSVVNSQIGPNALIGSTTASGLPTLVLITNSTIIDTDYGRVHRTTINGSIVRGCLTTFDGNLNNIIISLTDCNFLNTNMETDPVLVGGVNSTDLICTNVTTDKVLFYSGESGFVTYNNSIFENSTVGLTTSSGGGVTTLVIDNSKIHTSTLVVRNFFGGTNIDGVYLENSSFQDDGINISIGNLNVTGSKFFNSTVYVNTDVGTWNTTIDNCQIFSQVLTFDQAADTTLINTFINDGQYRIKYTYDFSTNNLIVGSPFFITNLTKYFSFNSVIYTSGNTLVGGAGAKLGLGKSVTFNDYISDVLITTINSSNTVKTVNVLDRLAVLDSLFLNATVDNITAGKISIVIEGNMLEV